MGKQVNIISFDSKLPNLAMEKVKRYYLDKGYSIESLPMYAGVMPTYVSVIFTKNRQAVADQFCDGQLPGLSIGGSGWDINCRLPAEIEAVKPRINFGYCSRGCNNRCSFCLVPAKEGDATIEGDLYDLWDGRASAITLLDNNILQLPTHFRLICEQAQRENLKLDFNQGLDIRLLTDDVCAVLEKTRLEDIRFALDSPALIPLFREKLALLRRFKVRKDPLVYVLCGFNTTWDEDMERILFLKGAGCRPYVMKHERVAGEQRYTIMQEWCNQFWPVAKMSYEDFAKLRSDRPDRKKKASVDFSGWLQPALF